MQTRSGIIAGGNWLVDKLKLIDTYPQQDALACILSESLGNGGGPFNVLVDLARMGARFPLTAVGLIGADANGEWISAECARHGIGASRLRTHPLALTSYTDVMTVQATGRRTFFHQRGANAFLDDEHFDFSGTTAKIFYLGYLLLLDRLDRPDAEFGTVAARTLHRAGQAGCLTSIDLVSEDSRRFAEIILPALPQVDVCFLNEFELERTTGISVLDGQKIDFQAVKAAATRLIEAGVRQWVVVHFPEAACALGRDGGLHVQGSVRLPQSSIVGTVGAGDAFAAGVLHGLHEGLPIQSALRQGVCVAAACLHDASASGGVRPLAECLVLEKEFGVRSLGGDGEAQAERVGDLGGWRFRENVKKHQAPSPQSGTGRSSNLQTSNDPFLLPFSQFPV